MILKRNKKSNFLKTFLFHAGGILIIGIAISLIVGNIKIHQKRKEFLAQVANLKSQIQNMQDKNGELKQGISKSDNPEYIEKIAREELDLQKEGEKVVSFIMPQESQQKVDISQKYWQSWLSNAWNWIKNKF